MSVVDSSKREPYSILDTRKGSRKKHNCGKFYGFPSQILYSSWKLWSDPDKIAECFNFRMNVIK